MSMDIGKPAPNFSKPTDGGGPLSLEIPKSRVVTVLEGARSL